MASYQILKPRETILEKFSAGLGSGISGIAQSKYQEALSERKEKKDKELPNDIDELVKDALLFDENIPEVGKKLGLKEEAKGFPLAGGGGVLPGVAGGEFDPSQLQTIKTPNYGDIVRSTLLERSQPGVKPEKATKNIFGVKEAKTKETIPAEFETQIAAIFASGQEVEDPRAELKKLIPLYAGNKTALDRLKLLISLYPEI